MQYILVHWVVCLIINKIFKQNSTTSQNHKVWKRARKSSWHPDFPDLKAVRILLLFPQIRSIGILQYYSLDRLLVPISNLQNFVLYLPLISGASSSQTCLASGFFISSWMHYNLFDFWYQDKTFIIKNLSTSCAAIRRLFWLLMWGYNNEILSI